MNKLTCDTFGGEKAEAYNVLMSAFEHCAKGTDKSIYSWLEKIPKTSMVCYLVDALETFGYEINRKKTSHYATEETERNEPRTPLTTSIAQAIAEERERIVKEIRCMIILDENVIAETSEHKFSRGFLNAKLTDLLFSLEEPSTDKT